MRKSWAWQLTFKCYGILVLYQWRIQYDLRFVPGNRPYGGDHGHRCDQIVGIPFLTLWFCESVLHMGVRSVWYSVVISNGISALILYVLYRCGIWKKTRIKVGKRKPLKEYYGE